MPFYLLLAICLLLAVGLSVAALRRPNRQRLAWRLVAGWAVAAGLWLLAYPPTQAVPVSRHEAIVLTAGYQPDTLRQLLERLGAGTRLWRYGASPSPDTPALHSLLALREQAPTLQRIHVLGRGLPSAALAEAGSLQLVLHDAPPFAGFQLAQWSRQLTLGQPLEVQGRLAAPVGKAPTWVVLGAAGKGQDSAKVAADGAFRLRYVPKATGLTTYELRARTGATVIAREPVPVEVAAAPKLHVLLLASTPGFEFRFLKDHLATRQHAVALRVQVSRGLTQTEFLNQSAHDLSRLTPALLARYDAVVTDHGALAGLSTGEAQSLRAAIQNNGLGLLLLADPTAPLPRALPARATFAVVARPTTDSRPQPVRWADMPTGTAALLPASLRLRGSEALVTDARQQPVVAAVRTGAGHVLVSTVAETFSWLLQQPSATTYDAYWSKLLTVAARPAPVASRWQVLEPWPRPDMPITLRLETTTLPTASPTVAQTGQASAPLTLRQDTRLPEWSTAQFWPASAGWHRVQLPGRPDYWLYVFAADAWQGPVAAQRQQAATVATTRPTAGVAPAPLIQSRPWPVGWFLALVLVGAGMLWLEEKL